MADSALVESIRRKYEALTPLLNERLRRLWAAAEAEELGWGGVTAVAHVTGLSQTTISVGLRELRHAPLEPDLGPPPQRVRRPGGGRKPVTSHDPSLLADLEALVDPVTRGDPQSPLRWTCKSTRKLAEALCQQGHRIGYRTVAALLEQLGYSLQSNRKAKEGASHPDRNAQFQYISDQVRRFQRRGQPVVSVDTKKKELVGDFKNAGREYQPRGSPEEVRVHDFQDKELGKAIPYGVYDLTANRGGSAWGSITTPPGSPSRRCGGGGPTWDRGSIRRPRNCWSPPTPAGATAAGCGCGRSPCRDWPMRPVCGSRCATQGQRALL